MKTNDSVIVITGASSGIGRASALTLARQNAVLVLMARRGDFLEDIAEKCRQSGAKDVLVIPADVREKSLIDQAVKLIIDQYGKIDVWVNNAAVTMFSQFEESPLDDFETVIKTNLMGYIYCAHAVLPHFRENGKGILINVSSVVGYLSQPYTCAYGITKSAILSFSNSLRQELIDVPDIHVCSVLPSSTDTPIFQMGANYSGKATRPIPPVYPAEQVAKAISSLIEKPGREVIIGHKSRLAIWLRFFSPGFMEKLMAKTVSEKHFQDQAAPPSSGNLQQPVYDWNSISGGWIKDKE